MAMTMVVCFSTPRCFPTYAYAQAWRGSIYIVQFTKYRHADVWKRALQRHLHGSPMWRWLARHNPAARLPTDFALLEIHPHSIDVVKVNVCVGGCECVCGYGQLACNAQYVLVICILRVRLLHTQQHYNAQQATLVGWSLCKGVYVDRQLHKRLFTTTTTTTGARDDDRHTTTTTTSTNAPPTTHTAEHVHSNDNNNKNDPHSKADNNKGTHSTARHWAAVEKPPGRWQTRPSMLLDGDDDYAAGSFHDDEHAGDVHHQSWPSSTTQTSTTHTKTPPQPKTTALLDDTKTTTTTTTKTTPNGPDPLWNTPFDNTSHGSVLGDHVYPHHATTKSAYVYTPTRRTLQFLQTTPSVTSLLNAEQLWQEGFVGKGVRMGVFDTGIREDHPHVKNIR